MHNFQAVIRLIDKTGREICFYKDWFDEIASIGRVLDSKLVRQTGAVRVIIDISLNP